LQLGLVDPPLLLGSQYLQLLRAANVSKKHN
jgi:hypothetical protein